MITFSEIDKAKVAGTFAKRADTYAWGEPAEQVDAACLDLFEKYKNESIMMRRARAIAYVFNHARLYYCKDELFVFGIEYSGILADLRGKMLSKLVEAYDPSHAALHQAGYDSGAYTGDCDFGHNCPDYETLLRLGIPGILSLAREKLASVGETAPEADLYRSVILVYEGLRALILRYAAICGKDAENDGDEKAKLRYATLVRIADHVPVHLHEAMQLQLFAYGAMFYVTGNMPRSLGLWDRLLVEFYRHDLAVGAFAESELRAMIAAFIYRCYEMKAPSNTPLYLCGLDEQEHDASNELTRVILEEYMRLNINDPKIQIRWHPDIPDDIMRTVLTSIASGKNSFVFLNDAVVIKALEKLGASHADAVQYGIVGCYEPLCTGKEIAATCSGRVILPKAIEYAFTSGRDVNLGGKLIGAETPDIHTIDSFEQFYDAVKTQIAALTEKVFHLVRVIEKFYSAANSAPIFAPLLKDCMEKGKDPYDSGARYNNCSINVFGAATAADSLIVVKKAVFEEKRLTLEALYEAMNSDWKDREKLRLLFSERYPKYGNGDPSVDFFVKDLFAYCGTLINGAPNGRGGVFRLGAFSIDWAFTFGAKTRPTPDGRFDKAPLSKNMGAATAKDKKGVTALIRSVTSVDYTGIPNGTVLDLMLHHTVFSGDEGIRAACALVRSYMEMGGFAVHINVFDPETLRNAQKMPDKYRNLQVRRCGWNVYFCELSRAEQDEFIRQAENL